ncbi:MAG: NAD(P)H-dependent glycerol-3-phosphate dehydrogenase [Alcaligenaceae bacterium]|nr:NAD(P)H-dependent glycerol-3-phosphate dehydrogenase [Alcaligenaceae bacterium]
MQSTSSPEKSPVNTLVIGAGSWGTALAIAAAQTGPALLWSRHAAQAKHINQHRRNPSYLQDIDLPESLKATASKQNAIDFLQHGPDGSGDSSSPALIIFALPVKAMRQSIQEWLPLFEKAGLSHVPYVWTCKGFEEETSLLPHEIIADVAPTSKQPSGVLSGPTFAREVAQCLPVAITVASHDPIVGERVIQALHSKQTRVYYSQDIIGVEVGGALKNVIALACGISDGLALGNNARAALITRGLSEIRRLGLAMGGHSETFSGLTGLGDLVLTSTGDLSRNRQVGLALAKGQSLEEILATGLTAEGVRCARAALARATGLGIEMPITEVVCDILFNHVNSLESVAKLLAREVKAEDA